MKEQLLEYEKYIQHHGKELNVKSLKKMKLHLERFICRQLRKKLAEEIEQLNLNMELTIKEYTGFNYQDYTKSIVAWIDSESFPNREFDSFKFLPGTQQQEWEIIPKRYSLTDTLDTGQVDSLRFVLKDGFIKNKRLVDIQQDILNKVRPEELKLKGGRITIRPEVRANLIARTETVRATNQGLIKQMKEDGIEKGQWIASAGQRTCPFCDAQNGRILLINELKEQIPAHGSCRCIWAPV